MSARGTLLGGWVGALVAATTFALPPAGVAAQEGRGCHVFRPCPSGYSCHPFVQRCYHEPRREGQPCMAGYSCGPGLTCEAGSQRCRAPGREGDSCHATRPCGPGLTCEAGTHVCRAPSGFGEACHLTRPCAEGLYCEPFQQRCAVGGLDLSSAMACSNYRVPALNEAAREMSSVASFGAGSWGTVGNRLSLESGTVYGPRNEYGCYATVCGGVETDVSLGSYGAAGLFLRWSDFQGISYVIGEGASTPFLEMGFQTSQILDNQGRLVGTASGMNFGVGLSPVQVGGAMCCTVVVDETTSVSGLQAGVDRCRQQILSTGSGGAPPQAPVAPTPSTSSGPAAWPWVQVPGSGTDIGVGAGGHVWVVNADDRIYYWAGSGFVGVEGRLRRIAVGPDGMAWGVNAAGSIFVRADGPPPGGRWIQLPGMAVDIGVGANGAVWVVNRHDQIFFWSGGDWVQVEGALRRIAVGPDGMPWGVNASEQIFRRVGGPPPGGRWQRIPGAATDIGVGPGGTAWVVNRADQIFRWNGGGWTHVQGQLEHIAVGPGDDPWGVNASGGIFRTRR